MFTAKGRSQFDPDGPLRSVAWNRGSLTGDRMLVDEILAYAASLEGREVGPIEGPYTYTNHLDSDVSAVMLIVERLVDPELSGSIPQRPALPPGAVG